MHFNAFQCISMHFMAFLRGRGHGVIQPGWLETSLPSQGTRAAWLRRCCSSGAAGRAAAERQRISTKFQNIKQNKDKINIKNVNNIN